MADTDAIPEFKRGGGAAGAEMGVANMSALAAGPGVRSLGEALLIALVGVLVIGCGIVINVAASRAAIPWILLVLALTFATQSAVQALSGLVLGALAGATVAGLAAAVVHRLSGRPLRLVVFLPAFWLLVPGSLGLLSTTEIATGHGGLDAVTVAIGSVVAVAAGHRDEDGVCRA